MLLIVNQCELKCRKIQELVCVILGVCYRSQLAVEQEIVDMFSAIGQASKGRCLITSDLNYPRINWDSMHGMSHGR